MATNTGHSSDPNYNPDARLKAKGILLAIRKRGPPLPTPICTWEVNRWFFLSQKDECSEDVPLLLELCPAPSEKIFFPRFVFLLFFNLAPTANEWSELERQVQISNRLQACPRAANTRGDGGRNVSQWTQEPSSQGEVALLSAGRAVRDQHLLPVGSLVLQSCSGPTFPPFASLGGRTDGWEVNLMRNVTVRYFVKKTTPTPPNISSFLCLCSSLDTFSLNCSSLAGTGPPCRDQWFTDSCDLYLICKFRL